MSSDHDARGDPDLIADGKTIWEDLPQRDRSAIATFLTPDLAERLEEGREAWDDLMPHEREAVSAYLQHEGKKVRQLIPEEPEGTWATLWYHKAKWGLVVLLLLGLVVYVEIRGNPAIAYTDVSGIVTSSSDAKNPGQRIEAGGWIIIADESELNDEERRNERVTDDTKTVTANLASLAAWAKAEGKPITFTGIPLSRDGQQLKKDGKPVLLAKKVRIGDHVFILKTY